MTPSLFIRFFADATLDTDPRVDWVLFNAEGTRTAGASKAALATLDDTLHAEQTPHIYVMIPGQEVLQTSLQIPANQKRHIQRTLPFLVEEHIATPIEEMHLSTGNLQGSMTSVFGINHTRMAFWQELLKRHHIIADAMLPDNLLGNLNNDELKIIIENERTSFHYADQPVITASQDNLTFVGDSYLAALTEQLPSSATLILAENLSDSNHAAAQALATQLDVEEVTSTTATSSNCFEYRCGSILADVQSKKINAVPNLQSASYQVTTERQRKDAPNWLAIAATVALCIALKLVFDLGTGLYLNYQTGQVDNQITSLYKDLFPQDKKIINAKVQMKNHLNEQGSGLNTDGFVALFSHMAKALKDTAGNNQAQVQQLRYNDQNQTLMLDIHVQKIDQLEQLKQALAVNNIEAAILSANEEHQWIKGRVRLSL
ncbi:MAG: type II secretion system protein GspL [Pseudomonadales bacterium]